MTGLETILHAITSDAETAAAEELEQARQKADTILTEAKAEGAKKAQIILQEGESEAQEIRERAKSAAQLDRRNRMLNFKQQLIQEAIDETRSKLENAPELEYFQILLKLISKFALPGEGELRLNGRDLARLPADFTAQLSQAAPESKLTLSGEPSSIESGCLLVYGGIDINCTFQAIFEDAADELRDAVGTLSLIHI